MATLDISENTAKKEETAEQSISEKLFSLPLNKEFLKEIVLEYLGEHAYHTALVAFERESGLDVQKPPLVEEREIIREMVEIGDLSGAAEKISAVFPFIFNDFPFLYFLILKQDILEDVYIRGKKESAAVLRIEKELSCIVEKNPCLLKELENLIGAVVFRSASPEAVIEKRHAVFEEINKKILLLFDYEMKDTLTSILSKTSALFGSSLFLQLEKTSPPLKNLISNSE